MGSGITLAHLNIRQSITILLARLITIDVVVAVILVGLYWLFTTIEDYLGINSWHTFIFLTSFILAGIFKISITIWIVLLWLNEYYEITDEYILHKRGIIFRHSQEYRIEQIRRIEVEDSLLGEIFNFSTITLYDIRLNKTLQMYLIHNPRRYVKVLQSLKPNIEVETDHTRLPFLPKETNNLELD